MPVIASALVRNRITSYNVCYTKLLRDQQRRRRIGDRADRRGGQAAGAGLAPRGHDIDRGRQLRHRVTEKLLLFVLHHISPGQKVGSGRSLNSL